MADIATIARPYAEALSELAKDTELSVWLESLSELAQLAAHPDIASLANNPNVSSTQICDLLATGTKTSPSEPIKQFINLVAQNHRISIIPEIALQFEQIKNQREGAAEVTITSAFPIDGLALDSLLASISKRFDGKALRPTVIIDPELIGGVRIQVGDEVLDSSVKSRLEAMQAAMSA
jgi:F-type H+-transporting ATPase subunit delta